MSNDRKKPESMREQMRQQELRNLRSGAFGDGANRASMGSPADLTGGLGWKATGVIIVLLIVGFVIYRIFF